MPDRKYEQGNDRQRTTLDFKQRVIDMMANKQPLPNVGIYDEPVRYFKANEQWCAVIFGWLDWLEDVAGWQEAQDESYAGIQQILIFEEGIEPLVTTQEELKTAICEGIECAVVQISKRIVSGSKTGFSIDDDGNIIIGGDGDEALPEDDPETIINEELAAKAGGANSVQRYINKLFSDLNTLHGVDGTPDTPLAQAQAIIRSSFSCDPALMDAAVSEYYANIQTYSQRVESLGTAALDGWIFCRGYSHESIIQYIWQLGGVIFPLKQNAVNLVSALYDDILLNKFIDGQLLPSTDYADYSCTKTPTETIQVPVDANVSYQGVQVWKTNHRIKMTVTGYVVDSDGDRIDFWWNKTAGGVLSFKNNDVQIRINGSTVQPDATQNEVVFNEAGAYSWTFDCTATGIMDIRVNRGILNLAAEYTFNVLVEDLGEIIT